MGSQRASAPTAGRTCPLTPTFVLDAASRDPQSRVRDSRGMVMCVCECVCVCALLYCCLDVQQFMYKHTRSLSLLLSLSRSLALSLSHTHMHTHTHTHTCRKRDHILLPSHTIKMILKLSLVCICSANQVWRCGRDSGGEENRRMMDAGTLL